MFEELSKEKYLSYKEKPLIRYIDKIKTKPMHFIIEENKYNYAYKAITLLKMPNYCNNEDLSEY